MAKRWAVGKIFYKINLLCVKPRRATLQRFSARELFSNFGLNGGGRKMFIFFNGKLASYLGNGGRDMANVTINH